jgi:hypothetical protein
MRRSIVVRTVGNALADPVSGSRRLQCSYMDVEIVDRMTERHQIPCCLLPAVCYQLAVANDAISSRA